jgi:hypothetical protein
MDAIILTVSLYRGHDCSWDVPQFQVHKYVTVEVLKAIGEASRLATCNSLMTNLPPLDLSPLFYSVDQYIDIRIVESANQTRIWNGLSLFYFHLLFVRG